LDDPQQWGPVAFFVAASPILHANDHSLSDRMVRHHAVTGSDAKSSDIALGALVAGTLGVAGYDWFEGDDGRAMEVAVESFAAIELETVALKRIVGRRRPGGGQRNSFPAGHAGVSFALATLLARDAWAMDAGRNGWLEVLGWCAYVPALWAGLNRVETGRHF